MLKFLCSVLHTALILPFALKWAQKQTDQQIGKMQLAAYNTPGAESPIPPRVLLGGAAFLTSHFLLARILGLRAKEAWLTLLLGGITGGIFIFNKQ